MARLASNLFDFRVVHGDEQLGRPLRRQIARNCPRHDTLFVHLVANACSIPPPLGFFRQLVVIGEGEHEGDLDIKRHGLLPIVDLARIHALAAGVRETGTLPRLRVAGCGLRVAGCGCRKAIEPRRRRDTERPKTAPRH